MLTLALLGITFIDLDDVPLACLAAKINPAHQQQIIIADAAAGQKRLSGAYREGDLPGFVNAIHLIFPDLEVRKVPSGWIVKKR